MEIDWITFSAQIVNLIVLGWILKKFLYRPILNALDAREKSILERINGAKDLSDSSKKELESLKKQKKDFEKEKYELFSLAKKEAEEMKSRLIIDVKKEVEEQKSIWLNDLERQKISFYETTSEAIIKSFNNLANKSLNELANTSLEAQMISVFKQNLERISDDEIEDFNKNALEEGKIKVFSSFDMNNEKEKEEITNIIKNTFSNAKSISIEFITDEKLICGIELKAKEKSILWSMKEYLNNFTKELKQALSGE